MRLNHIDLQVVDVQETAAFFEAWFGFAHVSNRQSPAIAILKGDGDFTLVIQKCEAGERFPEGFHIGFLRDDEADVIDFQRRAKQAGLRISEIIRNGRGTLTYVHAPGEILVEVSAR